MRSLTMQMSKKTKIKKKKLCSFNINLDIERIDAAALKLKHEPSIIIVIRMIFKNIKKEFYEDDDDLLCLVNNLFPSFAYKVQEI